MLDIKISNEPVAKNISRIIKESGLKQKYVAQKAGFTAQELNDMLNGRRLMRAVDIANIIDALEGVDANTLFGMRKTE
ncbi:XRE family transcriptional regulator [Lachnospiraceae bacterium]|nr:helix-turn-helix transcriptional regulator [uncultured Schaedlerella sp.]NBI61312.1 XRE family transcriptional regulator [Lachnospiraceae bacterium]